MKKFLLLLLFINLLMVSAALAEATAPPKVDSGDTSWILISSALVMLMTPGLALFYGGMVRSKNVLGTIMQSFIALGVITIQWVFYGYSLAFGPDIGGIIGNLDWIGLRGVGLEPFPIIQPRSPSGVHDFSNDVCCDHTRLDYRRIC